MGRIAVFAFAIACFIAGALVQRFYDAEREQRRLPAGATQATATPPAAALSARPPSPSRRSTSSRNRSGPTE